MNVACELVLKKHCGNVLCDPYEADSPGQELADAGLSVPGDFEHGCEGIIARKNIVLLDWYELKTGSSGTDCPVSCNKPRQTSSKCSPLTHGAATGKQGFLPNSSSQGL